MKLTLDFNQQEDKVYDTSMTLDNFHLMGDLQEHWAMTRPLKKEDGRKVGQDNRRIDRKK